jgi:hypothetical protein
LSASQAWRGGLVPSLPWTLEDRHFGVVVHGDSVGAGTLRRLLAETAVRHAANVGVVSTLRLSA